MAWFAAHELFTALHQIRGHAEALLTGTHGPLPLAAVGPLAAILEATCRLDTCLRGLAAIESLRAQRPAAAGLRPIPLAAILRPAGLSDAVASLPILARAPEMAGDALTALLAGQDPRAAVRVLVGRRHLALVIACGAAVQRPDGEGAIQSELARVQLAAAGARLRRMGRRVLILWRRAAAGGFDSTPAPGSDAASRDRT